MYIYTYLYIYIYIYYEQYLYNNDLIPPFPTY